LRTRSSREIFWAAAIGSLVPTAGGVIIVPQIHGVKVMILFKAMALGVQLMLPFAVADSVPELNVEQVCEGIAKQGGVTFHDPAVAKEKQNCLESERATRDELVKKWSEFTASDRTSCVNEARMGGDSSYTELLTCLEMARDVRAMRAQQGGAMDQPAGSGGRKPR
jgi:hypothetical protein